MRKLLLFFFLLNFAVAQEYLIKVATIAPEGSTWINVLREYDAQIRKESNGRLGFKIYAGGVAGDEIDVLKKIRIGQYHAGGFTGVGIGEIAPNLRVLDSPFLFKS
ncbi:TRAP transporter substrate-binding protein DctP, partial [Candidatus Kryptobacter tengchongensis]